jgi:hypothetical protein
MYLSNIHHHGMFCQKVRAAKDIFEELKALQEYKQYMDAVENDMLMTRRYHLGKTAD